MEQIEQLRAMRDAARARLEATPDHRLMTSLTALIEDLENAFGGASQAAAPAAEPESQPEAAPDNGAAAPDAAPSQSAFAPEPARSFAAPAPEPQAAPEEAEETVPEVTVPEETVVVVETVEEIDPGQINFDEIDLNIAPSAIDEADIERVIAAEVLSMNGDAMAGSLSESAEDAVNRALDELSIDLADTLAAEPATRFKR